MKTIRFFIMILLALSFMIACEPEEEIIPDNKEKTSSLPFDLVARTISPKEGKGDELAVELNWQRELKNGNGFIVERSMGDSTNWSEIAQLNKDATSFKDTELQGDSTFYYRVKVIDSNTNAFYSKTAFFFPKSSTPNAPSNLVDSSVPSSSDKMNLNWQDNSHNETGFIIERSLDANTWSQIKMVRANTTSYQDNGLKAATKYYYRVIAYSFEKYTLRKSQPSNIAEGTTNIEIPENVVIEALGPSKIKLNWDYKTEDGIMIALERSLNGQSWTTVTTLGSNTKTFTDSNLSEETRYYYRLYAEKGSVQSSFSQTLNATTFLNTCLESGTVHLQNFVFSEGCELTNVTIQGNITVMNGTLRIINSKITGNIIQIGEGSIEIKSDSYLEGNIQEYDGGSITIIGSRIKGHLEEHGLGNLTIKDESNVGREILDWNNYTTYQVIENDYGDISIENSRVYSQIGEKNSGNIIISHDSRISGPIGEQEYGDIVIESSWVAGSIGEQSSGNIIIENSEIVTVNNLENIGEQGSGDIKISKSSVEANLGEQGSGKIDIENNSTIGSSKFPIKVAEADGGSVYLRDISKIKGDLAESGTGNVYLDSPHGVEGSIVFD